MHLVTGYRRGSIYKIVSRYMYWRYQWLWLYGFVHPKSGETYYWILPKVNVELFNEVLADFAREFKLGQDKHIILTVDRAGWHTSKDLNIPEGLHLKYLEHAILIAQTCNQGICPWNHNIDTVCCVS